MSSDKQCPVCKGNCYDLMYPEQDCPKCEGLGKVCVKCSYAFPDCACEKAANDYPDPSEKINTRFYVILKDNKWNVIDCNKVFPTILYEEAKQAMTAVEALSYAVGIKPPPDEENLITSRPEPHWTFSPAEGL